MTSVTLSLNDELLERIRAVAASEGVALDTLIARLVETALEGEYELDSEERAAVEEGIADADAGRWVSREELRRSLKEQRR